jgi:protein ImuA
MGSERHLVLAQLRAEIRRIERRPARREGFVSSGLAAVDAALPGGGFPRGALAELAGGPASGKTAVALAVFAALAPGDLAAYVDGRGELYPPAAAARGVDLARLLVVRPVRDGPFDRLRTSGARPARLAHEAAAGDAARAGLWAAEALLASGAFAAVAVDVPVPRALRGADAVARRLQAAAEKGGAVGLWLGAADGLRVPAAVRVELAVEGERIVARPSTGSGRTERPSTVPTMGGRSFEALGTSEGDGRAA